jgi:hypothetical protein
MKALKKTALTLACVAALGTTAQQADAANWLMLQGTEPAGTAERAYVWGFLQPTYTQTDGTPLPAGTPFAGRDAVINTIAPDQKSDSQFQILRAQVGVRGQNLPLDPNVNYFFLAEFGNNGVTANGGGAARLLDGSITLNHIPGARIRAGLFKTPTAEEGLQAIHVFDYINFTNVTDQMLLERFFDRDGAPACTTGTGGTADTCANRPNGPVGAFRDIGVQVFDAFTFGNFELSYAAMLGNGNGINRGDNNSSMDTYYYLSGEYVFGGSGVRREGLKFFAWQQDGKRTLVTGGTGTQSPVGGTAGTAADYDRTRSGLGLTFRKSKYRAAAEYIMADGMIFDGTDGGAVAGASNAAGTTFATFNIVPVDKADGYYVDFGYLVLPNLELDVRYDSLNRRTDVAANERQFTTTTLGVQYFFNQKTRATLNYELREAEAPNLAATNPANLVLDATDNRISLQLTAIF